MNNINYRNYNLISKFLLLSIVFIAFVNCNDKNEKMKSNTHDCFSWEIDRFADAKILRYKVPGFEELSLQQKELLYYLSEAALCGRDIIWDQNYKYNLMLRNLFEKIYSSFEGDKNSVDWLAFETYLKRMWLANGIHHHYSMDKFEPQFSKQFLNHELQQIVSESLIQGMSKNEFIDFVSEIIFNPEIASKRVILDSDVDVVAKSANNLYEGVTTDEAVEFYKSNFDSKSAQAPEWGLNSKLMKENNTIFEKIYKLGGMYSDAILKIVENLQKAEPLAENEFQKNVISKLIEYYKDGDVKTFDAYNILWVKDTTSLVDFVNGFIEVYGDPLGRKGTWESVVNFKNVEATKRSVILSNNAQWFENNSPINDEFKKKEVVGVTAKVINIVMLGGDCYPTTPIGINLPNNAWVRKEYGSKSVTIDNVMYAYDMSSQSSGALEEFAYSDEEIERAKKYGFIAHNLHVDMHECLGHGSGQQKQGVTSEALKTYYSTIEEARADLFALYYTMDEQLIELGLIETLEVGKAEYDSYIRAGLMTQLKRIEFGKDIEESHMRNRQLIVKWVYEKGKAANVIEKKMKDGKTYFVVNDYHKLRALFGKLLAEVQRIKSEGDYDAAKYLVESFGVEVDTNIHREVLSRFEKLDIPSFSGFVNPIMLPIYDNGKLIDVKLDFSESYVSQMLRYSTEYSFLPLFN
jgi:dipeptidyl-peptidase III